MTRDQFVVQINRLSQRWRNVYVDELAKLIWLEVKDFDSAWLERTVNYFIGSARQAPLVEEFRQEASRERERLWRIEKEQHRRDAHDFFESKYHPDEVKQICQTIIRRLHGGVPDPEWNAFVRVLEQAAKEGA